MKKSMYSRGGCGVFFCDPLLAWDVITKPLRYRKTTEYFPFQFHSPGLDNCLPVLSSDSYSRNLFCQKPARF